MDSVCPVTGPVAAGCSRARLLDSTWVCQKVSCFGPSGAATRLLHSGPCALYTHARRSHARNVLYMDRSQRQLNSRSHPDELWLLPGAASTLPIRASCSVYSMVTNQAAQDQTVDAGMHPAHQRSPPWSLCSAKQRRHDVKHHRSHQQPRREQLRERGGHASLHSCSSQRPALEALAATPKAADSDPDIVSKI